MKKAKRKKKLATMDKILVICGVFLLVYTALMVYVFLKTGLEMSTLTTCVFGAVAGECGVMGWIKTSKVRHEERKWQKEDEKEIERS